MISGDDTAQNRINDERNSNNTVVRRGGGISHHVSSIVGCGP
jgi:hypothetical protein